MMSREERTAGSARVEEVERSGIEKRKGQASKEDNGRTYLPPWLLAGSSHEGLIPLLNMRKVEKVGSL